MLALTSNTEREAKSNAYNNVSSMSSSLEEPPLPMNPQYLKAKNLVWVLNGRLDRGPSG